MKDTKRRLEVFSFYDRAHIERHLEAMAARGWLLERMGKFGWVYRRIEPKRLTFHVSYFPDASDFDPGPTWGQLTFQDFCERTGWQLACSSAQMQVFYNEGPDPLPIETDPALELETIHRAAKRSYLPAYFVLLLMDLLFCASLLFVLTSDPIGTLADGANFCGGLVFAIFLVHCLHEILGYFLWLRRAKHAAADGVFLDTPDTSRLQKILYWTILAVFAWYLLSVFTNGSPLLRWTAVAMIGYYIALFALVDAVKRYLKGQGASRGTNRALTIGAAFLFALLVIGVITWGLFRAYSSGLIPPEETAEDYPLVLEDLTDEPLADGDLLMYNANRSLILERIEIQHHGTVIVGGEEQDLGLEYTVTVVKLPALYDWCREQILGGIRGWMPGDVYDPRDPAPWGAEAAYELAGSWTAGPTGWYVLCYEDRIVELIFPWTRPTAEQMAAVGEAFRA